MGPNNFSSLIVIIDVYSKTERKIEKGLKKIVNILLHWDLERRGDQTVMRHYLARQNVIKADSQDP